MKNSIRGFLALTASMSASLSFATNGTMPHGYGIQAQGMGGVSVALPTDALAAANNPAGMAFIGNRADIGMVWLKADRGADIPGLGYVSANEKTNYFLPEFGYNRDLGNGLSIGFSLVGNGVGTKYDRPVGPPSNSNAGSELMQLLALPTLSYRVTENQALGVSLVGAYQRLRVNGVQHIGLEDQGFDSSLGYGIGLGWTGKFANIVTVGASYFSKTKMGKLDKYRTLLAGEGEFDIPERISLGVAVDVAKDITIGADLVRINWHDVRSLGNSVTSPGALGASNGPGFGWRDQNVYRIGVDYRYSDALSLRAGYSYGDQIIPSNETTLNYLAPVTPRRHVSIGSKWTVSKETELSFVYTRALDEKVDGTGASAGVNPRHSQHWLGIAYGWKY